MMGSSSKWIIRDACHKVCSSLPYNLYEPAHEILMLIALASPEGTANTQNMDVDDESDQKLDL